MINRLWALVIVSAAGGQVVSIFILKQFIEEIPKELFESAQIDGAGHLQQIRHIVLPLSGSVLSTLAISISTVTHSVMICGTQWRRHDSNGKEDICGIFSFYFGRRSCRMAS